MRFHCNTSKTVGVVQNQPAKQMPDNIKYAPLPCSVHPHQHNVISPPKWHFRLSWKFSLNSNSKHFLPVTWRTFYKHLYKNPQITLCKLSLATRQTKPLPLTSVTDDWWSFTLFSWALLINQNILANNHCVQFYVLQLQTTGIIHQSALSVLLP